jgi:hypothetical protein
MIIDWLAMGIKFNNSAKEHYISNRDNMLTLPNWADEFIIYCSFANYFTQQKSN